MRMPRHDADAPLDFSAAAIDAGCHFATIDRAARSGDLPYFWLPWRRKRLIRRADLEAWKARRAGLQPAPSADVLALDVAEAAVVALEAVAGEEKP